MNYRKPRTYIPPYTYCDRWCERCAIDKSKCLVYQVETDERLHREIDGADDAVGDQAVTGPVPEPPRTLRLDPIANRASALAGSLAAFLREHESAFPKDAVPLRKHLTLTGAKLARAAAVAVDEYETADRILQAQVAHRTLGDTLAALESIRRQRLDLTDGMLDLLAAIQSLRYEIESRWLAQPCVLLVPVEGDAWWGPLRDVTETLRDLRR